VIGLSIFAVLIQQINNLITVLSEEEERLNVMKNELVQVMKYNNLGADLLDSVVDVRAPQMEPPR
jgi:hypothetical protein